MVEKTQNETYIRKAEKHKRKQIVRVVIPMEILRKLSLHDCKNLYVRFKILDPNEKIVSLQLICLD